MKTIGAHVREDLARIFGSIAVVLALLIGAFGLFEVISRSPLWGDGGAAWVQAIGAIAAIVAAFSVANRQHIQQRRLDRERIHEDEIRRFQIVEALLAKTNVTVKYIADASRQSDFNIAPQPALSYLDDCRASIEALPPFDMPHADLVIYCAGLPRAIRELHEHLGVTLTSTHRVVRLSEKQMNDLRDKLDEVLGLTAAAGNLCKDEISLRLTERPRATLAISRS